MSPHNHEHNRRKGDRGADSDLIFEGGPREANDSDPAGVGASKQEAEASVAEQIQKLQAEKQDLMNTLVRRQADFDNYRKRVEKERQAERHRGVESIVEHLLPVLDAFDRALEGDHASAAVEYRKGFELIRRQLWDTLSKQGLKRIDSVGKEFDPHQHHAIERVETTEHADGMIIGELQPGYMFHDRVLRPAMVRVAAQPVSKSAREN
ncbi:MAG TPA: nucleotide exchange factor GrpE [Candidatus Limnocylindrales bacterium]|nr:nucleotide exchange factor GrpE [Candidatus Limnocylindrales bacterium]